MKFIAILFSIGILLSGYLPALPPVIFVGAVCLLSVTAIIVFRKNNSFIKYIAVFLLGVAYGIISGHLFLGHQLAESLAGQELTVEGQVVDLPQEDNRRQLFSLNVQRAYLSEQYSLQSFPQKILLSSYGGLRVKTGERWRLLVKLKVPRGFVNDGGFDYQVSLLRRGIGATGYLREGDANVLLQSQPSFSIDVLRYQLQQWLIHDSSSSEKGILIALLVGDTSLVDKNHWGEMLKTGTNHLIAISGLHLGFFTLVGFFIGHCLGRFVQLLWHRCPALIMGYIVAVGLTVFYSLVAGLNIPTLRTLIMLAVVQLAYGLRRNIRVSDLLSFALVCVLLYDPLAGFDIGFWLSFSAVALLSFYFAGRINHMHRDKYRHLRQPLFLVNHFVEFVKSQWVMFIGLMVPLALLVHSVSLVAPAANFIAIPVITFFVVPCLILAALSHYFFSGLDFFLLHAVECGLACVREWLIFLLQCSGGTLNPLITINPLAIVLALASVIIILSPRGLRNLWLGCVGLILSLLIPLPTLPPLHMMIFDVGQGTAVLIQTPHHQLLYDTGPLYTENFDAGSGIIVPYLQRQNLRALDTIVVSHNDQDHSGGLAGVLAATPIDQLLLGEPEKYALAQPHNFPVKNCHTITPWQWDEVNFRFITWEIQPAAKANNHSCVLLVEYGDHKILLTGDIEKEVEQTLVASNQLMPVDVLLAPHHGSHTSSTAAFIAATHPRYVIYSAGYHNQHGHPHQDVRARYQQLHAVELNTAFSGALEFSWSGDTLVAPRKYRDEAKRFWFSTAAN